MSAQPIEWWRRFPHITRWVNEKILPRMRGVNTTVERRYELLISAVFDRAMPKLAEHISPELKAERERFAAASRAAFTSTLPC